MPNNWQAVAEVISDRMYELRLTQVQLAKRSGLSQAIIREIQYNITERHRRPKTLKALSEALELPTLYLTEVLAKGPIPRIELQQEPEDPIAERLDALEQLLATLVLRLDNVLLQRPTHPIHRSVVGHQRPRTFAD
ncbi:hypothetical protein LV75_003384 [Actinokineospora diospyrosa]|uniref:HTH cro/C1-type domain-containing protein n=1 Tax=Actinokineospora diospyrosa TaxID=103728 RepID=A0ABT1IE01_9PSEU|nr:hypothetical protein [Actinokineospora diospyrosa]